MDETVNRNEENPAISNDDLLFICPQLPAGTHENRNYDADQDVCSSEHKYDGHSCGVAFRVSVVHKNLLRKNRSRNNRVSLHFCKRDVKTPFRIDSYKWGVAMRLQTGDVGRRIHHFGDKGTFKTKNLPFWEVSRIEMLNYSAASLYPTPVTV